MQKRPTLSSEQKQAGLFLLENTIGYTWQAALRVAVELNIADQLIERPKKVSEIAQSLSIMPLPLYRILRTLAKRGVFCEGEDQLFSLTPSAHFLCSKHPFSLRQAILMLTSKSFWEPSGILIESVKGGSSIRKKFDLSFFELVDKNPSLAEDFDAGMHSYTKLLNVSVLENYRFPDNGIVVDIAGGFGEVLLQVLQENAGLQGILFDRPPVLKRHVLDTLKDNSRWTLQPGDFFESCPSADIYIIKNIIHDWPDDKAQILLSNCRKAMNKDGRVLIIERIIRPKSADSEGVFLDMLLLASLDGGLERTEEQLRDLLKESGLRINKIIDTTNFCSIIEAVAA